MSVAIFSEVVLALVTLAGGGDSADSANPVVREVIYKNAHHIAKKELDELSGIRPGAPLDLAANKTACFNIQDYLKKKGRYWAQVTLEKGDKAGDDQVIFDVTEGPIVRVRSTNFVGYQTQAELAELRKLIEMGRAFVGLTGPYSQAIIDSDVSKLEEYYDANGYRSARSTASCPSRLTSARWTSSITSIKARRRRKRKTIRAMTKYRAISQLRLARGLFVSQVRTCHPISSRRRFVFRGCQKSLSPAEPP